MKKIISICFLAFILNSCSNNTDIYATWNLISLKNDQNIIDVANLQDKAFISIEKNTQTNNTTQGKINGSTGCNLFFGDIDIQDSRIQSSHTGSTRMMCDPSSMKVEREILELFGEKPLDFTLKDKTLVLRSGTIEAVFEKSTK